MTERATDTKRDGGPAFPHESYDADVDMDTVKPGLSVRDYFAAQALAGICSAYAHPSSPGMPVPSDAARRAYQMADAMLRERAQGEDQ